MVLPTSSADVHHVVGVWSRLWEEDPLASGVFDKETLVHWTQAPCGLYVDIRLPRDAPGRSPQAAAAAGFSPNPLAILADGSLDEHLSTDDNQLLDIYMRQKSFAGTLMLAFGDTTSGEALANDPPLEELSKSDSAAIALCTCFWRRDIDYQPPSHGLDVGVCASGPVNDDGTIDMRETGADASYAELWHRLAGTGDGPYCALELVEENGVPRKGFWVRANHRFAYAIGRPSESAACEALGCPSDSDLIAGKVGQSLVDAMSNEGVTLQQVFTYLCLIGEVREDGSWFIESSTRPDIVGCTLIGGDSSACCSSLSCKEAGFVEQAINGSTRVRKWRIVEIDGFDFPLKE